MHFSDKITLTQVEFDRNKEGVYLHKGSPLVVHALDIEKHGDGWIQMDGEGGEIRVEEDAETITKLILAKVKAEAKYNAYIAKESAMGNPGVKTDDDDDD